MGPIIDQFPFNSQQDENELKSNVISEIAPVHGINDIKFMKGCYGKLSNFNQPSNAQLSGDMLVTISGQIVVYAQIICDRPSTFNDINEDHLEHLEPIFCSQQST